MGDNFILFTLMMIMKSNEYNCVYRYNDHSVVLTQMKIFILLVQKHRVHICTYTQKCNNPTQTIPR